MSVGFAIRSLGAGVTPASVVDTARGLDVRLVSFAAPPRGATVWRRALRAHAIEVAAVDVDPDWAAGGEDVGGFQHTLEVAAAVGATLRCHTVRVEVGRIQEPSDARAAVREAYVDRAVRALHPAVTRGVPVAVRLGASPADVLLPEELDWLVGELPAVKVWFDGARARRLAEAGVAPAPALLAERVAARCVGVTVSGGDGGGHPEDGGPDWSTLVATLPRAAAWVVDLDPGLGRGALEDAVRVTKSWFVR